MNIIQHLILTSENVSSAYIDYLNQNNISWIATGKEYVDLKKLVFCLDLVLMVELVSRQWLMV
ncbi:hypothetical protein [Lactobacillus acidophilus]|uniref:hypothetical protein n=1 Tax=Lactobacillus acidophilus TaxID=1579 RepID=UPI0013DE25EB|nr:hypothetical protein [Lactobacillus acidophilus]